MLEALDWMLQRLAEARKPITSRIRKAPAAGADAIEWFVCWLTAAAAPDFDSRLREMRPHLSPYLMLQVGHVVLPRAAGVVHPTAGW